MILNVGDLAKAIGLLTVSPLVHAHGPDWAYYMMWVFVIILPPMVFWLAYKVLFSLVIPFLKSEN